VVRSASRTWQCHAPNRATDIVRFARIALSAILSTDLVAELLDGPHVRQLERPVHLEPPTPCPANAQGIVTTRAVLPPRPRPLSRERRLRCDVGGLCFVCAASRGGEVRSGAFTQHCDARHGTARHGTARHGTTRHGRGRGRTFIKVGFARKPDRQRPSAHTLVRCNVRHARCCSRPNAVDSPLNCVPGVAGRGEYKRASTQQLQHDAVPCTHARTSCSIRAEGRRLSLTVCVAQAAVVWLRANDKRCT
jgi:hypothetical protein